MKPEKIHWMERLALYALLAFFFSLGAIGLALPVIGLLYLLGMLP